MRIFASALFAMLVAVTFGHTACASPQGKRIALLATLNTNPYIGAWTSTFMKDAAADGMKVTNLESPFDAALQSQQIDDAIAQKYDLIVVDYINDQAILPALTRAKAAGVPVVLMATPLAKSHEDLFYSYIGTDHSDLGRIAGENLVKGLEAEGKTKAKPAVWQHRADFDEKMNRMGEEAQKLPAAARSGDSDAFRKQVSDTSKACKSCHDDYKAK